MKILFNPNDQFTGTCSYISYDNKEFKKAVEKLFFVHDGAQIKQIEILPTGIAVILEVKK